MAGIRFSGVTMRFGDYIVAVDDLDLEIHDGEFMIFVGPSGCGKTTALRMVAELDVEAVILDVVMPDQSGYEICQRLREDSRARHFR